MSKWLQKAIQKPGRIKKLGGGSVSKGITKGLKSKNKSLRSASALAKRLRPGGDLYRGKKKR